MLEGGMSGRVLGDCVSATVGEEEETLRQTGGDSMKLFKGVAPRAIGTGSTLSGGGMTSSVLLVLAWCQPAMW